MRVNLHNFRIKPYQIGYMDVSSDDTLFTQSDDLYEQTAPPCMLRFRMDRDI